MRPLGCEPAARRLGPGAGLVESAHSIINHVIASPASSAARYRARGEMPFHELFDRSIESNAGENL
jgi:hypothetical protein